MDPSQVAEYYNKHFPAVEVCELFRRQWRGTDCLSTRELCIENVEGKYIRFLEADSAQQLKQLFVNKRVEKFHTGAVYDVSPSLRWKNATLTPRQRELVFDIDLDDYGLDKDDIHECDRGWPLVAVGFRLIAHCLKHHFGFKHTLLVYSGRRGAHLTVYDARACALTEEQRSAIVSWLQPAQRKGQKRVAYRYILQSPSFAALFDSFVLPFWKNFCLRPRCEGGMGVLDTLVDHGVFMDTLANEYARKTVQLTGLSGAEAWEELTRFAKRSKFKEEATWALKEAVMEFVWPKLDAKVTMQVTHLSKCVLSLHPKTGRLCVPVTGDPLDFKPEQCATLSAVVSGGALEKMEEARIALAKFTARLAKSETETWQPPKLDIVPPAVYNMTGQKRGRYGDEVHFAEVDRLSAGVVCTVHSNPANLYTSVQNWPYKHRPYTHTQTVHFSSAPSSSEIAAGRHKSG